ncbi:hypothetical protein CRI64_07925 [Escherichia sp. E2748]|nr:hypothetical protein CRI66_18100 [Escherichia sp. E4694]TGB94857.1 hypothetical protein CRI64_07925 [Escherichia sp. E2748]
MMKRTLLIAVWIIGLVSSSAMALTLNEARSQGRVGERHNGYLAAISTDPETRELVANINQARKESYQKLAESHNIPLEEVANLAGTKLVEKAKPGEYVQGINGMWVRK